MSNSLKTKIKKLSHDGNITDIVCQNLLKKLKGHDDYIYNQALDDYNEKLKEYFIIPHDVMVIDMYSKDLKKK